MGCLPCLLVLTLFAAGGICKIPPPPGSNESCQPEKMTVYKMVLHTFWTRDKFPKHYPDWRPPAQWSKVYGRSHDKSFVLFRLGERVSPEVRAIAEGHAPQASSGWGEGGAPNGGSAPGMPLPSESLAGTQGLRGVLDAFGAPPIVQGSGRTEANFFVDGNHSKVSVMSRMVPSPDWFVGIDSFDLCVNGNWLDSITIEVDPIDAGTDNGFTFTAPNWPTSPQGVAYRMTARYPSHPAGSFFYPHIKRLPPIATFQFLKLREYELSEVFHHASDDKSYEVLKMDQPSENSIDILDGNNALSLAIEEERAEREPHVIARRPIDPQASEAPRIVAKDGSLKSTPENKYLSNFNSDNSTVEPRETNEVPRGDKAAILNSIARTYRGKSRKPHSAKQRKHYHRKMRDCRVSEWGEWSACSRSCGIGETRRIRRVVRPAARSGRQCPPLVQTRWCGSARNCSPEHFAW